MIDLAFGPSFGTLRGWEAALAEYVDMEDKHEFYRKFDAFLEQPLEEQLAILDTLKD